MQPVIINAGNFVGRFLAGAALPYVGVIDLTIVTTVICAILITSMAWLGSVASVVILGVLYGLFSGLSRCCTSGHQRQRYLVLDRYRCCNDGTHAGVNVRPCRTWVRPLASLCLLLFHSLAY